MLYPRNDQVIITSYVDKNRQSHLSDQRNILNRNKRFDQTLQMLCHRKFLVAVPLPATIRFPSVC